MHLRPWLTVPVVAAALLAGTVAVPTSATAVAPVPVSAAAKGTALDDTASADTDGTADRYLVRYPKGADIAARARALRTQGAEVRRTFGHVVKAAAVTLTPAQAADLARSPMVLSVEPDVPVQATGTQTDAPWGLDRVDQRQLPLSTSFTPAGTGAGVDVYVVDTGVRPDHVDFGGRVAPGWTRIQDGRGTGDCNGHGTHVAGTVAGATHGVAKSARIVPVRVLDCEGEGMTSDVVAGLDWVAAHHTAGAPAVVNLSLGGGVSSTLDAAVRGVIADGVTAVVAAGNSSADACKSSPARVAEAVTVAAADSSDRQASFSNHGSCVDLYAPGVKILSTLHGSRTATGWMSGTSMAAPHVAGAAGVLLSRAPALGPGDVSAHLLTDATAASVRDVSAGTPNRLLFQAATTTGILPRRATLSAPGKATSLRAVARKRAARFTWVRGNDGGSPLTRQTVVVYRGSTKVGSIGVSGTTTALLVRKLKPRRAYSFRVLATNKAGNGPLSNRSPKVRPHR